MLEASAIQATYGEEAMTRIVLSHLAAATVLCAAAGISGTAAAQHPTHAPQDRTSERASQGPMVAAEHEHGAAAPAVSYVELQHTAEQLAVARQATARFQDVRVADSLGYRPIGPYVPGMGVHYVRGARPKRFDIAEPPILLYERDQSAPKGLRLAGLSYLLVERAGEDGQPATSPFPKSLVRWHKHNNICVLPGDSTTTSLSATACTAKGGRFSAETSWMLHAWLWKDSPSGVFGFINPLVK
jgi:hypothetical protein